ncbi:hypothetical protein [Halobacterium bonnevillei]|uniref:Uncharacterized protein n=1 Tax=Halobacterium bonnevillei TaxID=2692200 RepID=A0A6B0SN55_9EURY|nr:hypothetical protein [Halobacterium bonnevillei]MXR20412.1 hypothetical protein [Halobacterium bonnevillei]
MGIANRTTAGTDGRTGTERHGDRAATRHGATASTETTHHVLVSATGTERRARDERVR